MNTKSRSYKVSPEFEQLFAFSTADEKLEHRAQMISFRILSEVEKICEEHNIKMKDLAKLVNTSASYITQLFRGHKQVNTAFMARFEEAMNMIFTFSVHKEREMHDDESLQQLFAETLKRLQQVHPGRVYCFPMKGGGKDRTSQLLDSLVENENGKKQVKQIA